jgi:hypothetical protein
LTVVQRRVGRGDTSREKVAARSNPMLRREEKATTTTLQGQHQLQRREPMLLGKRAHATRNTKTKRTGQTTTDLEKRTANK